MRAETTVRGLVAGDVRAELARQRISAAALPGLIGGTRSYWQRRICGDFPMNVEDLAALADLLHVPASTFWCAVRELNPQPADIRQPRASGLRAA